MRAIAIAIAALTSVMAWADGSDVPGAGAKARIAGHVLVWHDAQLVFDPAQPTKTVQAATLKEGRRASVGVVAAMRVVGVRGNLVEVEPSKDFECTRSTFAAHDLTNLRTFVARADLAPVIVKRFVKVFDDGTRIELQPGMPIVPTDAEGVYVAPLGLEMLRVALPPEHVGYSYAAAPRAKPDEPPVAPGTKRFRMHMEVTATLGGQSFKTRKDLFTPIVGAVETKGNVTLFPIDDRCGRAKVALPKDEVETFTEPEPVAGGVGSGIGIGGLGGGAGEYLPAKTPMFAGKQKVGNLVAERAPDKDTKCFDVYVSFDQPFLSGARSTGQRAKVPLCAAPSTKLVKREGFGIGHIDEIAPLPASKEVKPGGHVLVSAEAKWFTDPTPGAKAVQLADPRSLSDKEKIDFVFAAKVIGTVGRLVEVELPKTADCAFARVETELASVRLFVERSSIMPVLAKPFSKTFKNGSRITLAAGVAVAPSLDGYIISINGEHASVPLPGASIAYSYTPVKVKAVPKDEGVKRRYSIDGDALLGDHLMSTKQTATRIVKRGDNVLFPLVAPCIDAVVVANAVTSNELGIGTAGVGVVAGKPIQERWFIAKGTPLLSAKGRAVAKAGSDIDVPRPADGAKEVCHAAELRVAQITDVGSFPVREASERTLTLCVPVEQVKHVNPVPPRP